jgi:hypothetical protein
MTNEIIDLDVLRPPERLIKLGGKTYDIGFIPIGVALDIDRHRNELAEYGTKPIEPGSKESVEASKLTLKIISKILSSQGEDMPEEWLAKNVTTGQAVALTEIIYKTLQDSMISAFPEENSEQDANPQKAGL